MDVVESGWSEFAVAMAGAAAALAGLIIVAMSVNIDRILKAPSVAARSLSAIGALVLAVVSSCLILIPGQPVWALGLEVLLGGGVLWVLWGYAVRDVRTDARPGMPALPRLVYLALAPAAYTIGGVLLMLAGGGGLVWIAAGAILSIVVGVVMAWIALVEILR